MEFCVLCEKLIGNLKDHVLRDHRQAMALRLGLKDWLEEVTKRASTKQNEMQTVDHYSDSVGGGMSTSRTATDIMHDHHVDRVSSSRWYHPGMSPEADSAQQTEVIKPETTASVQCQIGKSAKRTTTRVRIADGATGRVQRPAAATDDAGHGPDRVSSSHDMDASDSVQFEIRINEATEALHSRLSSSLGTLHSSSSPSVSLPEELDRIQNAITVSSEVQETEEDKDIKPIIAHITGQKTLDESELVGVEDANRAMSSLVGWTDESGLSFGQGEDEEKYGKRQRSEQNPGKRSRKRTNEKLEQCALCGEMTNKKQHHALYKHFDSSLFQCAECSYGSKHYNGMLRHISNSHRDKSSPNQEAKFFRVEENYRTLWEVQKACFQSQRRIGGRHGSSDKMAVVIRHIGETAHKKIECALCRKRSSGHRPKDHVVGTHLKVPLYKCSECDYKSKRAFNIDFHIAKGKQHPGVGRAVPIEENLIIAQQLQKHCFPKNEENFFDAPPPPVAYVSSCEVDR